MKVDLVLQIAKLALAVADQLLNHNVKGDPFLCSGVVGDYPESGAGLP